MILNQLEWIECSIQHNHAAFFLQGSDHFRIEITKGPAVAARRRLRLLAGDEIFDDAIREQHHVVVFAVSGARCLVLETDVELDG